MSNYPASIDIFVDKTAADYISSSDPNQAYDGIETTQGYLGASGKPQSWNTTLVTLLRKYRRGMMIQADGATLYVRTGEACLEDTNGSLYCFRQNAADVTITAANLDVGTIAVTNYYIYGYAPSAATTCAVIFSTDAIAPSGIGTAPYIKLGWFDNTAAGSMAFTYCGNIKDGSCDLPNAAWAGVNATTAVISSTGYTDVTGGLVSLTTNGRPVEIIGAINFSPSAEYQEMGLIIEVDGTEKETSANSDTATNGSVGADSLQRGGAQSLYMEQLAAGHHVIKLKAKRTTNDLTVARVFLSAKEL